MTPKLQRAFVSAMAICNEKRVALQYLQRLAEVHTEIKPLVDELESKLEYIDTVCNAGLTLAGHEPQGV